MAYHTMYSLYIFQRITTISFFIYLRITISVLHFGRFEKKNELSSNKWILKYRKDKISVNLFYTIQQCGFVSVNAPYISIIKFFIQIKSLWEPFHCKILAVICQT